MTMSTILGMISRHRTRTSIENKRMKFLPLNSWLVGTLVRQLVGTRHLGQAGTLEGFQEVLLQEMNFTTEAHP